MKETFKKLGLAFVFLVGLLAGFGAFDTALAAESAQPVAGDNAKPVTAAVRALICEMAGIGCDAIGTYEEEDDGPAPQLPPPAPWPSPCEGFCPRPGLLD